MKGRAEKAKGIAENAFAGKFRKDGVTPYFTHLEGVVRILVDQGFDEETQAVGWLHDLFEDTTMTVRDLLTLGVPFSVVDCVATLTHRPTESYETYIGRVSRFARCRSVKVADILHNLQDDPTENQRVKYQRALFVLSGCLAVSPRLLTYVKNSKTGAVSGYSLDPKAAVIAAHAQQLGDWSTWNYDARYGHLAKLVDGVWTCGEWTQEVTP